MEARNGHGQTMLQKNEKVLHGRRRRNQSESEVPKRVGEVERRRRIPKRGAIARRVPEKGRKKVEETRRSYAGSLFGRQNKAVTARVERILVKHFFFDQKKTTILSQSFSTGFFILFFSTILSLSDDLRINSLKLSI